MAYTSLSDIAVLLKEDGINKIFGHAKKQRPSLFNYGTPYFLEDPTRFCGFDPAGTGTPYASEVSTIKIPRSAKEIDFCYKLKDFKVDYSPQTVVLPPPLNNNVPNDSFVLSIDLCAGFKYPDINEVQCVDFQLYAVLNIERKVVNNGVILTPKISAFELVDIKPDELESIMELFVVTLLNHSIFPYLAFNTKNLSFTLGDAAKLTIELANLNPNPKFEDDFIKIYFNVKN